MKNIKAFERKKVIKGLKGPPITWEFVDEVIEPEPSTRWQKIKKWFSELPIWSRKID